MAITAKPSCWSKQHQDVKTTKKFPFHQAAKEQLSIREGRLQSPFVSAYFHVLLWSSMITTTQLMTTENLAQALELQESISISSSVVWQSM